MYDAVLVPLDGSKRSEMILIQVKERAKGCVSAVVLVQVVEPPYFAAGSEGVPATVCRNRTERRIDEAREYLASLRSGFREKNTGARTSSLRQS